MVLELKKGQGISLRKEAPGLTKVRIGLGWDQRLTSGEAFDLDASAFLVGKNDKVRSEADFIFYGQLSTPNGSVVHQGDNRTGEGDGDDEQLVVDLSQVDADVDRIVFTVTIYDALKRGQTFGQIRNSFIRLLNEETGEEVLRFDLTEKFSQEAALDFAELYRDSENGGWAFRAISQGYNGGLAQLCARYGLTVNPE